MACTMINQQCLPFECLQVEIQDIIKNFVDVYQCDADIVITTILTANTQTIPLCGYVM